MKKLFSLFLVTALLFALCACGSAATESDYSLLSYDSTTSYNTYNKIISASGIEASDTSDAVYSDIEITSAETPSLKIIYRLTLSLETKAYDEALAKVRSEAEACGGYISEYDERTRSDCRYATLTVRVPSEKLNTYAESIKGDCNVTSQELSTDDITDSYYSVQSRIDSLVDQESRLNALLEKADTLEYLLKIEEELATVRAEINELNYRIQIYDKSVNYSYVTVYLSEVVEYTEQEQTFLQKIADAFAAGFSAFGSMWQGIAIAFSWLFPFLIVACLILGVVFLITRTKKSKKASKKDE